MSDNYNFINPLLRRNNLDRFYIRKSIFNAIQKHFMHFHGSLLDVGCGDQPYKSLLTSPPFSVKVYLGLDIYRTTYDRPDLYWDGKKIPLNENSIDCVIATEVLEHCTNIENILNEVHTVLKNGGVFFFTVPFIWPLHDVPYDEFRYTPFSLLRLLQASNFDRIRLEALGGWNASLAQMLGLWVRRKPMSKRKRTFLSCLMLPIMKYLINHDYIPEEFRESTMITGIAGTAFKPSPSI